ncbi:hypothetical protein Psch_02287 [Pelotomaculum schinkii]|uniref:DUF2993 domain-containing protein n=1 Tax=Pelotomaculum schinkii TaxID=78350 RepID=A0A4Y7R8Y7_9FIRM|nr:hypothetical protein [Pelotomaculum schinkii]TEB05246.1 hypothetical protein Psch_02287 [Pelotomaculum schinkii]
MSILDYLIHGNLAIRQEIINKFLKNLIQENRLVQDIELKISRGLINLEATLCSSEASTYKVNLVMSLSNFAFNRNSRFVELPLQGPVLISYQGLNIKARLEVVMDPDPVARAETPENLLRLMEYLMIEEDKITIDFNQIPGFNQLLQKKLGFLLNNLEISRLELGEGMLIVQPSIKFF